MADKRQSIGGKPGTATPKVNLPGGAKDMVDMKDNLHKSIGARVKVVVAPNNTTYEGTIFTADPTTNVIVLTVPQTATAEARTHILHVSHLLEFNVLELSDRADGSASGFDGATPAISKVDVEAGQARVDASVRKLKEEEARRGKGVSKEAQEIFDAFARTLPTRWHQTTIVVNDSVMLHSPYTVENLQAPKDKQSSLPQVRKILEAYHQRKAKSPAPTPSTTPAPARSSQSGAPNQRASTPSGGQAATSNPNANRVPPATPLMMRKGG